MKRISCMKPSVYGTMVLIICFFLCTRLVLSLDRGSYQSLKLIKNFKVLYLDENVMDFQNEYFLLTLNIELYSYKWSIKYITINLI